MCLARFASWSEEKLVLVVGTAQGLSFYPRQVDGGRAPLRHERSGKGLHAW